MKYGIDNLKIAKKALEGRKVGLIASATSYNSSFISTAKMLQDNFDLCLLLAPEHGLRGAKGAGESFSDETDSETGLKVVSLYSEDNQEFPQTGLEAIDTIAYDIQDVGMRCYTYISTLYIAAHYCAKHQLRLVVFDRPNPLSDKVEGLVLAEECRSFVSIYFLTQRYGLTVGEFINLVKAEEKLSLDLIVIPCTEYNPKKYFDELDKAWLIPSPALPHFENALLYSAFHMLEGTNLSEGRGTTSPFALLGAPFIDNIKLCTALNAKAISGLHFIPTSFIPTFSKYKREVCNGVYVIITDKRQFNGTKTGLIFLKTVYELYPDKLEFLTRPKAELGVKLDVLLGMKFKGIETIDYLIAKDFQILKENEIKFCERIKPYKLY